MEYTVVDSVPEWQPRNPEYDSLANEARNGRIIKVTATSSDEASRLANAMVFRRLFTATRNKINVYISDKPINKKR